MNHEVVTAKCVRCGIQRSMMRDWMLHPTFCEICKETGNFIEVREGEESLRDQFAMAALPVVAPLHDPGMYGHVARSAYLLTDSMMKARSEKTKNR